MTLVLFELVLLAKLRLIWFLFPAENNFDFNGYNDYNFDNKWSNKLLAFELDLRRPTWLLPCAFSIRFRLVWQPIASAKPTRPLSSIAVSFKCRAMSISPATTLSRCGFNSMSNERQALYIIQNENLVDFFGLFVSPAGYLKAELVTTSSTKYGLSSYN